MMNYYIGTVDGAPIIFGEGNTERTAIAAGQANAKHYNATSCRVVKERPANAAWFDCLDTTPMLVWCWSKWSPLALGDLPLALANQLE
jgi:hypothetical protein